MFEATILLTLLGVVLWVIVARGNTTTTRRPTFITLSPELKPAKKVSRKRFS